MLRDDICDMFAGKRATITELNDAKRFGDLVEEKLKEVLTVGASVTWSRDTWFEWDKLKDEVLNDNKHFMRYDRDEIHAHSYLHARAFLLYSVLHSRLQDPVSHPFNDPEVIPDPLTRVQVCPSLYRGQSNYQWYPYPSLFRLPLGNIERQQAESICQIFEAVLSLEWEEYADQAAGSLPFPSPHAGRSAAQHYNVPTNLLDWTPVPDVALAFACSGQPSTTDEDYAIIFILPLATAQRLGLRIYLPPIYVHRLFLQRGVFIELKEDEQSIKELEKACIKLVFPRHPLPEAIQELLPADAYFDALRCWAKFWVNKNDMEPISNSEIYNRKSLHDTFMAHILTKHVHIQSPWSVPDPWYRDMMLVPETVELMNAIALHCSNGEEMCLNPVARELIRTHNMEFFLWLDKLSQLHISIVEQKRLQTFLTTLEMWINKPKF